MSRPHGHVRPSPFDARFPWAVDWYDGRGAWVSTVHCKLKEDARRCLRDLRERERRVKQ